VTAAAATDFDLTRFLDEERERVDDALADAADLLAPGRLRDAVRYALQSPGKRLRPILLVAAYRAAGGAGPDDAALYRLATAVEVVHAYSLVHDDLPCMDDDDLRRGRPTVHRAFDAATAVAAGALMIPLATTLIEDAAAALELDASTRRALVRELCDGAGAAGMVGGQWLDLRAERSGPDVRELEAIHSRKTGALIAAAARMGGVAAGADEQRVRLLGVYGNKLGLAFQIADDLLDVTADAATLGKTAGRDLELGKSTYPALLGIAGARELALAEAHVAMRVLLKAELDTPPLLALARYAVERER